jgi:high-affinity Fe2+/Pb2+ permease
MRKPFGIFAILQIVVILVMIMFIMGERYTRSPPAPILRSLHTQRYWRYRKPGSGQL